MHRPSLLHTFALALVAFLCALVVTSAVLSLLAHRLGLVVAIVIFVPLAVVGAVIAWHQPATPSGG